MGYILKSGINFIFLFFFFFRNNIGAKWVEYKFWMVDVNVCVCVCEVYRHHLKSVVNMIWTFYVNSSFFVNKWARIREANTETWEENLEAHKWFKIVFIVFTNNISNWLHILWHSYFIIAADTTTTTTIFYDGENILAIRFTLFFTWSFTTHTRGIFVLTHSQAQALFTIISLSIRMRCTELIPRKNFTADFCVMLQKWCEYNVLFQSFFITFRIKKASKKNYIIRKLTYLIENYHCVYVRVYVEFCMVRSDMVWAVLFLKLMSRMGGQFKYVQYFFNNACTYAQNHPLFIFNWIKCIHNPNTHVLFTSAILYVFNFTLWNVGCCSNKGERDSW